MKIKWNWGTGLFISIVLFMSFILIMVYNIVQVNFDLVEDDYYPQAIVYQQKIDKTINANKLDKHIKINQTDEFVQVVFQDFFQPELLSGEVFFYRPSVENKDLHLPIKLSEDRTIQIPISELIKGRYVVKIDYKYLDTPYYQEINFYLK